MFSRVATILIIVVGSSLALLAQPPHTTESHGDEAHELRNKALILESSDPAEAAFLFYQAGKLYDEAYMADSAVAVLIKSLALYKKLDSAGSIGEAQSNHALGDIYKYVLYDFDAAESCYERALSIQERQVPPDPRNLTRLYYNLATTNRSQLDYEKAIGFSYKAIEGAHALGDKAFLERCYSVIGNIYRDMRRYDSAGAYYQKGIGVNRLINQGRKNETLAGFLSGWGDAFYKQGKLNDARARLDEAVAIYDRAGSNDKLIYLHTIRLLAEVQMKMNDMSNAWSSLQKAEALRAGLNTERGGPSSAIYKSFGDYYFLTGNSVEALNYYQRSLRAACRNFEEQYSNGDYFSFPPVDDIELKSFAYDALLAKAEVFVHTRKDLTKFHDWSVEMLNNYAMQCYLLAELLVVNSRTELDSEDARLHFVDANFQLYEKALDLLGSRDPSDTVLNLAFHFMEGSKSKLLADALQEIELKKTISRSDTLLHALRKLKQHTLALQHKVNEKNEASDRDELIDTNRKIAALESRIDQAYPAYLKIRNESATVPLLPLHEKVAAADATLIEYFWGEDNIYAFVVPARLTGKPGLYNLGPSAPVREAVDQLVAMYGSKSNQYSKEAVAAFVATSNSLYKSLVAPVAGSLSDARRIIIVPDGPIAQIPFETLVVEDAKPLSFNRLHYLLNDHIISYAFSGSYIMATGKRPKRNLSVLAFGFTGTTDVRSPDGVQQEIAGTETELLAIQDKFPQSTLLYGADVTEKKFKDVAGGFDLLHLAVHGSGDTNEDYSAALYFRDAGGPEDGRLYWYEMYGMNLQASLAVLSSCESGIGKSYRGEGMLSMANAFTFAGCSNIVMGLWKVDDQVSVKLMNTFYSELINGMALDEALAMAKRTYLASADQVSANPKLWGSLVAYGETPILTADKIHTGWLVVAITVLIGAIVVLVVKTRKK